MAVWEELPDGWAFELEDILSAIAGDVLTAASADAPYAR